MRAIERRYFDARLARDSLRWNNVVLSCEFTNFRGASYHAVLQMFRSCKYTSSVARSRRSEHGTPNFIRILHVTRENFLRKRGKTSSERCERCTTAQPHFCYANSSELHRIHRGLSTLSTLFYSFLLFSLTWSRKRPGKFSPAR